MEDELVLDGAIISAAFDDALETVSTCNRYRCVQLSLFRNNATLLFFCQGIIGTTSGTLWYVNWDERTSIRLVSGHAQQVRMSGKFTDFL